MSVSVLMSVYAKEHPEHLFMALQSIATQTQRPDEVVLVEDGPISAELKAVIEQFRGELNIKSVRLEKNCGLAVALNEGLKYCSCQFVARMDSDDICLPDRFEKQIAFMKSRPEIDVSSAWVEEIDETGKVFSIRKIPTEHEAIKKFALIQDPINHPVAIFRKEALLSVGGYPNFRKSQDTALWSLMLQKGFIFGNIDEVLLKMRAGNDLMRRRNLNYLIYELKVLCFQRQIGFISWPIFFRNAFIRSAVRLSPTFVKRFLYKYARGYNIT